MGNTWSVISAIKYLGFNCELSNNIDKISNALYAKYKEEDKYDSSMYTPTQPWFNYIPNNMIIPEHLVECN